VRDCRDIRGNRRRSSAPRWNISENGGFLVESFSATPVRNR
jgi:hypothetical protein